MTAVEAEEADVRKLIMLINRDLTKTCAADGLYKMAIWMNTFW
jgi:hypothetical protein